MSTISPPPAPPEVVVPPSDDNLDSLLQFSGALQRAGAEALLVGPDGEETPLPHEIYQVLVQAVNALKNKKVVTISPVDQQLTTQEAADFLGISRPTLVKLLEKGSIPYEKLTNSRHRRIRINDLIAYKARHKVAQQQLLQQLVEDAEDSGLYDNEGE